MKPLVGLLGRIVAFVVWHLPRFVRELIAYGIGLLWFDVLRIRRKVAIENVGIAFPEKSLAERTRIARSSLVHMGRTIVEFSHFPWFTEKDLDRYFVIENMEIMHEALKQKKGAIMLTLHGGNGDYATMALSRSGLKLHLISKIFKAEWLNDLWFGMRRKHGTSFIAPEKSSFDILRALKKNEIVIFVLDQFMGPPVGVRTKFFGKETGTAAGCALMAGRTGAPVVFADTYRRGDGKTGIVFQEVVPFVDSGLMDKNIAVMTQIYTDKIEGVIRQYPEQWMWIHRRWKDFRD